MRESSIAELYECVYVRPAYVTLSKCPCKYCYYNKISKCEELNCKRVVQVVSTPFYNKLNVSLCGQKATDVRLSLRVIEERGSGIVAAEAPSVNCQVVRLVSHARARTLT